MLLAWTASVIDLIDLHSLMLSQQLDHVGVNFERLGSIVKIFLVKIGIYLSPQTGYPQLRLGSDAFLILEVLQEFLVSFH